MWVCIHPYVGIFSRLDLILAAVSECAIEALVDPLNVNVKVPAVAVHLTV